MVEFNGVVVMFPGEKGRLWGKGSCGEVDSGHGVLLHENSTVSFGVVNVIGFGFKICIFNLVLYDINLIRQRR